MMRTMLMAAVLLALVAGCKATQTATPSQAEPGSRRFEVERGMRPFLDCAYAQYAALASDPDVYEETAAEEACRTCEGLLEVYKARLWAMTQNDDFGIREEAILREYAKEAMAAGALKAR